MKFPSYPLTARYRGEAAPNTFPECFGRVPRDGGAPAPHATHLGCCGGRGASAPGCPQACLAVQEEAAAALSAASGAARRQASARLGPVASCREEMHRRRGSPAWVTLKSLCRIEFASGGNFRQQENGLKSQGRMRPLCRALWPFCAASHTAGPPPPPGCALS